jgi:hypothetical protein
MCRQRPAAGVDRIAAHASKFASGKPIALLNAVRGRFRRRQIGGATIIQSELGQARIGGGNILPTREFSSELP